MNFKIRTNALITSLRCTFIFILLIFAVQSWAGEGFSNSKGYTGEANYQKMAEIYPRMDKQYMFLGAKHARTKFKLDWDGSIRVSYVDSGDPVQKDDLPYDYYRMQVSFGAGYPPVFEERDIDQVDQRLLNGYLPALESKWRYENLEYSELFFSRLFDAQKVVTGNETTVGFARLRIRNSGSKSVKANLWISMSSYREPFWKDNTVYDDQGRIRMVVESAKGFDVSYHRQFVPDSDTSNIQWEVAKSRLVYVIKCTKVLAPKESADVYIKMPYFPLSPDKSKELNSLNFNTSLKKMTSEWESELKRGMKIETPDRIVNEIYKANMIRFFITPDKDPKTGLVHFKYNAPERYVSPCESITSLNALDKRGYYPEVAEYLNTAIAWQGSNKPIGQFSSQEGVLESPPEFAAVCWVVKNNWELYTLCEHYKFSRDRAWLDRVLPNILASCDWINRERTSTKKLGANGEKPIEYGLLPPGKGSDWLEDPNSNWIWTDAYGYQAVNSVADVLESIGHPRAEEIRRQAIDYRDCIRAAVKTAVSRSVRIKFKNGEILPYVPPEIHQKDFPSENGKVYADQFGGWDTWVMYGHANPLTLVPSGVFDANEDIITWSLRFMEDYDLTLYFPGVSDPHPLLFNGVSLMLPFFDSPAETYYWRGEIDKSVEAFYAMIAGSMSRKIYVGCDHGLDATQVRAIPITDGIVSKFIRRMLVQEDGNNLLIAWATPRAWLKDGKKISVQDAPTYFGPMGYKIVSHAKSGNIEAIVNPPNRNPPSGMKLKLRLRHPDGKNIKSVLVNDKPYKQFSGDVVVLTPKKGEELHIKADF